MPDVDGGVDVQVPLEPVIGCTQLQFIPGLQRSKPQRLWPPHRLPSQSDAAVCKPL